MKMTRAYTLLYIVMSLCLFTARAQKVLYVHQSGGTSTGLPLTLIDSLDFSEDKVEALFHMGSTFVSFPIAGIDSLSFGTALSTQIFIHYDGVTASVINPMADSGVEVTVVGADVTVNSTTDTEVEYILTGASADGSFKLYGQKKFILTLSGVTLTNTDGPAINIQTGKKATVHLVDGTVNSLTDGAFYTASGDEDMKGTLFSEGQLVFTGGGTLQVAGNMKHGICSDDYVEVQSGHLILKEILSDGIHANDYILISGGTLEIAATSDGLDGDAGFVLIEGGTLDITVTEDASKGIKCDSTITVTGGDITIRTSGAAVVEEGDPSYCTAIKGGADVLVYGGTLTVTATGIAGRGISADGDVNIYGGEVNITTSGNGSTYTNASSQKDSYSAACIKADGNILIQEGTLTLASSGTAGKGISADGTLTIGDDTHCPVLNVKTSGKKITISSSGMNGNYANPKAIKSEGDLTVNNGQITVTTTQDGGEGLESKGTVTINGGTIEAETYDDGINASSRLVINGGRVYCNASNNDGIDSNGTLAITGGLVISSGTSAPEEGIDCDQNNFAITGGVLVATGGATSTPTTSSCTQHSVVYGTSGMSGKLIHIQDASGNAVLTYKCLTKSSLSSAVVMLMSSDKLAASTTYTIYTGGTVTGGEEFHGYYTDATYTAGTQATTFTTSSMVTTIGTGSGGNQGPGGGPGNRPW